jgi:hypothetical protein
LPIVRTWFLCSAAVALVLLAAVWAIARSSAAHGGLVLDQPPFAVGGPGDVLAVLGHNLLVLALHAMACLAGFIAGSSLPLQAERRTGWSRAARRGAWDELLAATFVTVAIAAPILLLAAVWEVYAAPHVVWAVFGH